MNILDIDGVIIFEGFGNAGDPQTILDAGLIQLRKLLDCLFELGHVETLVVKR